VSLVAVLLLAALTQDPGAPVATGPAAAPAPTPAPAASTEEDGSTPATPSAPQPYDGVSGAPQAVRPFEMPAATPAAPIPYGSAALDRIPTAPVEVEDYRRSYEAAPDALEQLYQAGIQRTFDAQQVRMGPLDGQWTVRTEAGSAMLSLLINDAGPGSDLEGAWRQLGPRSKTGLLLSVSREGEALVVSWYDREGSGDPAVMRLRPQPGGAWRGTVRSRDIEYPVTMSRR